MIKVIYKMVYEDLLKKLQKLDKLSIKELNEKNKDHILHGDENLRTYKRFEGKTYEYWISGDSKEGLKKTMEIESRWKKWHELNYRIVKKPKITKISAKYLVYVRPSPLKMKRK